ncbi:MAG: PIG-L family deacetylase [Candidatus Acidiferrales bacterium]
MNRIVVKLQLAQSHQTLHRITNSRISKQAMRSFLAMLSTVFSFVGIAQPLRAQSLQETVEAIHKSRVNTRILFITAHPDDEWSSLLSYLSHGLDADVALLTITRGQGGQNAIGPEQDGELGVIRTEELLAAGKYYGVHQYFTRALDTGYVKTPEQALKVWDGLALEDMVRVIRTYRPDVVINGWGGVHSGHGHHQESGILTPQAVAAAADPKMYPEQIAEGLAPWKVTLETRLARDGGTAGAVELPVNEVSPLWGKSYVEIGMEGHAQHRSQGTPAFFGNAFFRRPIYLVKENEKGPAGSFDVKLLAEPLTSLVRRFPNLQQTLAPALASADRNLAAAAKSALDLDRASAANSLAAAGKEIASLREQIAKQSGDDEKFALWELDAVKNRIDLALADDIAIPFEARASRHELVAGENFSVDVVVSGEPAVPAKWTLSPSSFIVPTGWTVTAAEAKESGATRFNVAIPADAKPPARPGDAILPFPPPLVRLALPVNVAGYEFAVDRAVDSVQASTTGILTYPLELVPAVTITVEPRQIMVPEKRATMPVKLFARVRYHGTQNVHVSVALEAPTGWTVQLPKATGPLEFSGAGDQLLQFIVTPPAGVPAGAYTLHPTARIGDEVFSTSLAPIPTLPTRDWSEPADAKVHILNLIVPAGLRVGYIAADNDPLPEILRQLGIRVDLLDDAALAFGDLSQYDAITVGIRAYELRPDLLRANSRLLNYVKRGGTLLVQYQRDFAWNSELPAPFKAAMPEQTSRVTDANSPVTFLAPDSPLLNSPNKITQADFQGWVQERGLYFWGTFDSKYTPVLGLTDPGEPETKGSLVFAKDGQGLYIYTGLSFFRELPAGVPGAYRLFVNLLSQTKHATSQN